MPLILRVKKCMCKVSASEHRIIDDTCAWFLSVSWSNLLNVIIQHITIWDWRLHRQIRSNGMIISVHNIISSIIYIITDWIDYIALLQQCNQAFNTLIWCISVVTISTQTSVDNHQCGPVNNVRRNLLATSSSETNHDPTCDYLVSQWRTIPLAILSIFSIF